MSTQSERLTNLINSNFFFKEFSYSDILITLESQSEIELADLLVSVNNRLMIFQLKERDKQKVLDVESEVSVK